jgi:DNA-binding PadR family transcriptional regulator
MGETSDRTEGLRPSRKYYEVTREGEDALAEAVKRYRLLDQSSVPKATTKPLDNEDKQ